MKIRADLRVKYFPLTIAAIFCASTLNADAGRMVTPTPLHPVKNTEVRDQAALETLRGTIGLTVQWFYSDQRGELEVSQREGVVHLKGSQNDPDGTGRLEIEGDVLSIDTKHFILRGRIELRDTPDAGRSCTKVGDSEFAITQNRKYWRMREFEWCDHLTDYIDIYF